MDSIGATVGYYVAPLTQLAATQFEISCLQTENISKFARERLGYNAMGSTLAAAAVCFTATHLTGIFTVYLSVPLMLAGGAAVSFYLASAVVDYEDEAVIDTLRKAFYQKFQAIQFLHEKGIDVEKEICGLIPRLEEEHEIEHRNRYGLPFGNDFSEIFAFVREHISFNEALEIHKGIEGGSRAMDEDESFVFFPDPPAQWKDLFFQEVARMDSEEIAANYNFDELLHYNIINEEQKRAIDALHAAQESFTQEAKGLSERLAVETRKYRAKMKQIEEEYAQLECHEKIAWYTKNLIGQVGTSLAERDERIEKVENSFLVQQQAIFDAAGAINAGALEGPLAHQHAFEEVRRNTDRQHIERAHEDRFRELEAAYKDQIAGFLESRERAYAAKEQKVAAEKEKFENATRDIKQQLAALHTASGYQQVKDRCKAAFRS